MTVSHWSETIAVVEELCFNYWFYYTFYAFLHDAVCYGRNSYFSLFGFSWFWYVNSLTFTTKSQGGTLPTPTGSVYYSQGNCCLFENTAIGYYSGGNPNIKWYQDVYWGHRKSEYTEDGVFDAGLDIKNLTGDLMTATVKLNIEKGIIPYSRETEYDTYKNVFKFLDGVTFKNIKPGKGNLFSVRLSVSPDIPKDEILKYNFSVTVNGRTYVTNYFYVLLE